jgi:immune inhibitor A
MDPVTDSGFQKKGPFYAVAEAGKWSKHRLGSNVPASRKGVQAVFTLLPDNEVPMSVGEPAAGEYMFYSDKGDNLNNTMTNLSVSGSELTAKVNYEIEQDWDYAYLEATTDGGATWSTVPNNLSTDDDPNQQNDGNGITGVSDGWVDLTATLPEGTNGIRFRYWTDVAFVMPGFRVDEVAVDGTPVGTAETADEGWELDGFYRTTGQEIQKFFNAYVLENRQYDGYDKSLKSAYNFGFLGSKRENWVEDYPYQDGMLVWYWNEEFTDNNVGDHPGEGLILPVDAQPQFSHWEDGTLMRPRILSYDSTFGLERTDKIKLHLAGKKAVIASKPRRAMFDDSKSYWFNSDQHAETGDHEGRYQPGWYSVDVPNTGTTIRVLKKLKDRSLMIRVAPKR